MLTPLLILLSAFPTAEPATPAAPDPRLREVAAELFPNASDDEWELEAAVLPGYFRLSLGTQIFYLSEDGRYLLAGPLYDLQTKQNLTAASQAEARKALLQNVDLAVPIHFSENGAAPRTGISVVTNINCTFCRQLHQQLDEYLAAGIDIQYVMLPAGGGAGYEQTAALLCSDDPAAAVAAAMLGKPSESGGAPTAACRQSLDEHVALARKLGAVSTPNLVLPSGELIQGYQSPAQLRERLDRSAPR
ncbi:MAG: DsbC family protein [Pseudomonadota bacterium]